MIMGGLGVAVDGPAPGDQGGVGGVGSSGPSGGARACAAVEGQCDVGLAVGDERGQDVFDGGSS